MGGRGQYLQKGGFRVQAYHAVGEIDGVKVIERIDGRPGFMPQMSNSPNAIYILKSNGYYKSIGIYGSDRRLQKDIHIQHEHKNRLGEKIPKGIAHVHHLRGGRLNNVRKMSKKERRKYGALVQKMGGKWDV